MCFCLFLFPIALTVENISGCLNHLNPPFLNTLWFWSPIVYHQVASSLDLEETSSSSKRFRATLRTCHPKSRGFTKDGDSEAKKHVTSVTSMKNLPIYPLSMIVARMKTLWEMVIDPWKQRFSNKVSIDLAKATKICKTWNRTREKRQRWEWFHHPMLRMFGAYHLPPPGCWSFHRLRSYPPGKMWPSVIGRSALGFSPLRSCG